MSILGKGYVKEGKLKVSFKMLKSQAQWHVSIVGRLRLELRIRGPTRTT
jgi:hypothetical protein